jgi:electron transfer flavoprotein alpha/beta subunit
MGVEEGMVIVDNEMALVATLATVRCLARVGPETGGTA